MESRQAPVRRKLHAPEIALFNIVKNPHLSPAKRLQEITIAIKTLKSCKETDINAKDTTGDTALSWASYRGHIESIMPLLKYGACPDSRNHFGYTALDNAIFTNCLPIVSLLLNAGATLNKPNKLFDILNNPRYCSLENHIVIECIYALYKQQQKLRDPTISSQQLPRLNSDSYKKIACYFGNKEINTPSNPQKSSMNSTQSVITALTTQPKEIIITPGFSTSFRIPYNELSLHKKIACSEDANIYEATWQNTIVAVKELSSPKSLKKFNKENNFLKEMQKLELKNVVQYRGYAEDATKETFRIVMEYMPKGDAMNWIIEQTKENKKIPWTTCYQFFNNAAFALEELHDVNIVHGDLKWENILITTDNKLKLADFGYAFQLPDASSYQAKDAACGTPGYIAPEAITKGIKNRAADIYSFGSMMYIMTNKNTAFYYNWSDYNIIKSVAKGERLPIPEDYPPKLANLINRCWMHNHEDRPSARKLHEELQELAKDHENSAKLN
jgi:tRNA A-37 threonylcarbamoyl transferase component Bud32